MTEKEFRIKYSELIEYYQFVELRLKGICAALFEKEGKSWLEKLDDFENDPLGKMINKLKEYHKGLKKKIITDEDFQSLEILRENRNYWCHKCFIDCSHVTFTQGKTYDERTVRRSVFADKINSDLQKAIEWDEYLTMIFRNLRDHIK